MTPVATPGQTVTTNGTSKCKFCNHLIQTSDIEPHQWLHWGTAREECYEA